MIIITFTHLLELSFIMISVYWLIKIIRTQLWLRQHKATRYTGKNPVIILLPVLNEAIRLPETIRYFLTTFKHINLKICIITTARELQEGPALPNTISITQDLCRKYTQLLHVHYPEAHGKMSHQLNYAMKQLRSKKNRLFAIYNADSRPDPRTLDWVLHQHEKNQYGVFQQYGNYTRNIKSITGNFIIRAVLSSAAHWQSRWSIGVEIPNALRQFTKAGSLKRFHKIFYPFNYCIGHGLFYTSDVYKKTKGFYEDTFNEDLPYGMQLNQLQIPIIPVPYFDIADTPNSINGLYIQKSNWFYGPLQSFTYFKKMATPVMTLTEKLRLTWLVTRMFLLAIYWITGPTIMLIMILTSNTMPDLVGVLLTYLLFLPLINTISMKIIEPAMTKEQIAKTFLMDSIGAIIMYTLHGVSAYRTLIRVILTKLQLLHPVKLRTPMLDDFQTTK